MGEDSHRFSYICFLTECRLDEKGIQVDYKNQRGAAQRRFALFAGFSTTTIAKKTRMCNPVVIWL
ncbi:MAG: hypothetical protein EAZ30_13365 [Betaproteobacteria bacterium]|nr:MAG: hypothetical protein EAZ30_13365 [Betaproteobacteria bacterium]